MTDFETANPEQAAAWNGTEGEHWAEHADQFERVSAASWQRLLDRQLVRPTDRVLDIGCGTGGSTRDLARHADRGEVVGVDLSGPMLAVARRQTDAAGLTNVTYLQADVQIHPFEAGGFDVAVSSFGAMFFADPIAAFANVARGSRPGAPLALLAWRELDRNEWLTAIRGALAVGRELPVPPPGAPGPFALADPARVQTVLTAAGFEDIDLEPVDERLVFGTDPDHAFGFLRSMGVVRGLTQELDPDARESALAQLRATVDAHTGDGAVTFGSSAWLITARAAGGT